MGKYDIDIDRLETLFKTKWEHAVCPLCKGEDFSVDAEPASISSIDQGRSVRLIIMYCKSCGYVAFIYPKPNNLLKTPEIATEDQQNAN